MFYFLIIIYCALFAFLAWRRLDWAVMLIIFSFWSYLIRFSIFGFSTTLLEAMLIITAIIFFGRNFKNIWQQARSNLKNKRILHHYPFDWEIILLLIISFFAVAVAGWSNAAFGAWKAYFFEPIIFFLIVINVFGPKKQITKIIYPLAGSTIIIALIAVWQKITHSFLVPNFWTTTSHRVTSLFPYPNALGLYLAPLILLFLGVLLREINHKKIDIKKIIILSCAIILSVLAIYFAQSEGALAGILVGVFIFFITINKKTFIIGIITIVLLLGSLIYYQPVKIIDKLTLFDLSGQIRRQQWRETKKMLLDNHLITGVGLHNYQKSVAPYHQAGIWIKTHDPKWLSHVLYDSEYRKKAWQPTEIYLYPHNIFLNFWSELGLLGLLLFLWLIIKYLFLSWKNSKHGDDRYLYLGLLTALIVLFVHGLVDVPYFKNDLSLLFWTLFAILGILIK